MRKLAFQELQALSIKRRNRHKQEKTPFYGLLDDIRSLHNVGSIFRTADAVNMQHLYICGITGAPPRNEIRKTSLGAEEAVDWSYHADALTPVRELHQQGCQIVALEQTDESVDYRVAPYRFPLCLIIGHEYNGVNEALLTETDLAIQIPMLGVKQSLNVAVAFGVAIYEIYTKWQLTQNTT
ncbi:RNA methyltransferase [candidate division KSB1 bacterium]|nr:RNA methyltransferase [candidate division KSB1 bacterium]